MGQFICPKCGKSFGQNKDWFEDHLKAHILDENPPKVLTIKKEERVANLKSISNAIKSDRIRVWVNYSGAIVFENTKTKNETCFMPYYDMDHEHFDEYV